MSFAPKQFIRSVDFLSTENAINTSTGCVNIYGGMSVSKDSYLTNMIVVGNSTITNLNITGTLRTSNGNSLISSQWINTGSNGIYFGTSSNTLVGIGTTTPGFTLDISGGSRITGGLTVGNLNVNTGATITNILNTTICTGTILTTGITTSNLRATGNVSATQSTITTMSGSTLQLSSGITTGSLNATSMTTSSLRVTGTMNSGDVTVGNINFTGSLFQNGSAYLGSQWTTTAGNTLTYTSGNVNISNTLTLNNPANATNVSSGGALTVVGGAAVGGDLIVGGSIIYSNAASVSSSFAYLTLTGTDLSTDIGNGALVAFGGISVQTTENALSASSGSGLTIGGGAGIGKDLYVGGKTNTPDLITTNISVGTIRATTSITTSTIRVTGNADLSTGLTTVTDLTGTNITSGTIRASTLISTSNLATNNFSAGTIRATTLITSSNIASNNLTSTNILSTNISTNTLISSTVASNVVSSTTYTGANMSLSGNLNVAGTLTTVNITSTNLVNTNVSAGIVVANTTLSATGTSNTISNIFTTGGNVGIGLTNPAFTLDVTGSGDFSTFVTSANLYSTNQTTTHIVSTNITSGTIRASTLISTSNLSTAVITGSNILNTNLSSSIIQATGITTGTIRVTGNADLSTGLTTVTDLTGTNISSGTIRASTLISTSNLGSGNITSGNIISTSIISTNLDATNSTLNSLVVNNGNTGTGNRITAYGYNDVLRLENTSSYVLNRSVNILFQNGVSNWPLARIRAIDRAPIVSGTYFADFSIEVSDNLTLNEYIRIQGSSGNIGIGTTSPAFKLDVSGTGRITSSLTTESVFSTNLTTTNIVGTNISSGTGRFTGTLIATNNSNTIGNIFTTAGNVGIGTTSPTALLYINSASASYNRGNSLYIKTQQAGIVLDSTQSTNGRSWNVWSTISSDTPGAGSFAIFDSTASTYRILINTSGNVGVGLTAPTTRLDVAGTTRITNTSSTSMGTLIVAGPNSSAPATATSGQLASFYGAGGAGSISNIDFSTYLPASSAMSLPSVRFSMLDLAANNSNFNILTKNAGSTGTMASRMFIDGSGNIGLNTTNPSTKLHIEDGSVFIGDISSGFSTSVPSGPGSNNTTNGHRLFFDNSFNGTAGTGMPANKIVLHNNAFTAGFGLETDAVTYHSGNGHRFYCSASTTSTYGSLTCSIFPTQTLITTNTNGEGLLKIGNSNAGSSAFGMLRIGNNIGDAVMFLNSSTRTADGGTNTFTIRNDSGALRLQGGGATNTIFLPGSSSNVGIGTTSPSYALQVSGDIYASGDVISFSDARLKTDVVTIENALEKVSGLRGVYYTNLNTQTRETGVIAQEIAEILPEVVADKGEYLGVAYGNIVGILIEAIKELKTRVSELENR